jgi:hypothetical protein
MGHEISKHGSGLVRRDRSRTKFRRRKYIGTRLG